MFFDNLPKKGFLQLELAAIVDCREKFVKACNSLEGDRIIVIEHL